VKKPDIPADEKVRLETLRTLNLLDTAPEERFDRLTRLARRIFGVPISLVSLVDGSRQWFKSTQGLEVKETPREISFCGHAILEDDIFIVPDALKDERFVDNPLVTNSPGVRFYAGCPLKVANGSKIGTLCLIDTEPRQFSAEDLELLRDLAMMVEQEIAAIQLATIDELTRISNRRGFKVLAQHALSLCNRKGLPASLLVFDLDDFKQINDSYGHAEGDRALAAFAECIRDEFRESDVFARLGGDEFVALLTDTDQQNLEATLKRFHHAIDDYNKQAKRGYDLHYSVGHIVCEPGEYDAIDQLLASADTVMYKQKRLGKTEK